MKKIKFLIASMLGAIALVFATVFGTRVNAASYEQGNVNVTTTTNTNDTKTWTFTTGTDITFSNGDDLYGIYIFKGNNKVTMKANDCLDMYTDKNTSGGDGGSYIYVPIPEDTTSGSLTVLWTSNNSNRGLYLTSTGDDTYVLSNKTTGATVAFDSTNINSDSTYGTYLKLYSYASDGKSKENKLASIKAVVVGDSYETVAADVNIDIYDGSTVFSTQTVKEGSYLTYTPTKLGYVFDGYYTDSGLQTSFDYENTSITSSITTLYAKFTADSNYVVASENSLDGTIVSYMLDKLGTSNLPSEVKVTDTIYTLLTATKMQTSSSVACVATGGAVSTTNKSIKIEAPAAGKIVVSMTTQGDSARNAKFINSSSTAITASSGNVAWDATAAANYEVRTIEYPVESAGSYYIGGDNGMRIFSIEFVAAMSNGTQAAVQAEKNSTGDTVRFIGGMLLNDLDLANVQSIELILKLDGVATSKQIFLTTCYTSVTGASISCPETKGVYYVIYRVTGVKDLTGTISKQLKVTFTDGSTTLSEVTEITL
ncbi:MAG: InlB B-repeat-containing protein [Acholeplasmatales bacterium]|nr:InlB B-repeat-containing protein [Acholeplasmatales bacterium]